MSITEKLAAFITEARYNHVSSLALQKAKRAIIDCIGVAIAGAVQSGSAAILDYLREVGGRPQATLIGHGWKASVVDAALANGFFAHVLDFDDTNLSFVGHPTAAILPAILAIGERIGASGADIVVAYLAGTEVQWRLGDALVAAGNHYSKGWHTTCTLGSFGAAAACAKLLKLDCAATANALGIAASEASGFRAQFGTHCKPFQAGKANQNGARAALLARSGFTSAPNALEGKLGFISLVADSFAEVCFKQLEEEWSIADTTFARGLFLKKHPVCGSGFGVVEGIQELLAGHAFDLGDIEDIRCGTDPEDVDGLKYHQPQSALEAKFSLQAWVAITLVEGRLGLPQLTDEVVRRPDIQALMKKIKVYKHPDIKITACRVNVQIRLASGRILQAEYYPMKGAPNNDLAKDEIVEKFMDCCALGGLSATGAESVLRSLNELESLEGVKELMSMTHAP
jgi:2-methylcitrate dehydratase PrpD